MFNVKIHSTPNGKLMALCDSELVGRVFEEGEKQLNLNCNFYKGSEESEERIKKLLRACYVVNAVGEKSVKILIEEGLVEKKSVKKIGGVEYAQCVVEEG
jgi:hypothetical protein